MIPLFLPHWAMVLKSMVGNEAGSIELAGGGVITDALNTGKGHLFVQTVRALSTGYIVDIIGSKKFETAGALNSDKFVADKVKALVGEKIGDVHHREQGQKLWRCPVPEEFGYDAPNVMRHWELWAAPAKRRWQP